MSSQLIPVFTGQIKGRSVQLSNARDLHSFLQSKRKFADWIKARIEKFGFSEGEDYLQVFGVTNLGNQKGGNKKETIDYHLTLDMAKELAMVENNEMGRQARRYYIECEQALLAQAQPQIQQPFTNPATVEAQRVTGRYPEMSRSQRSLLNSRVTAIQTEAHSVIYGHLLAQISTKATDQRTGMVNTQAMTNVLQDNNIYTVIKAAHRKPAQIPNFGASLLGKRFLVTLDEDGAQLIQQVPEDAAINRTADWARMIATPGGLYLTTQQLVDIAQACFDRLTAPANRAARPAPPAPLAIG